jgi:hypothetical protein
MTFLSWNISVSIPVQGADSGHFWGCPGEEMQIVEIADITNPVVPTFDPPAGGLIETLKLLICEKIIF